MAKNIFTVITNRLFREGAYGMAYRKKGSEEFNVVLPTSTCGYADSFIYEYNGITAVFVEMLDFHYGLGTIGVFEIKDGQVVGPKEIIKEPTHMSFPNIFEHNGQVYMIPETYSANDVHLYKCKEYPYKWEKTDALLSDCHIVDCALYENDGITYIVGYDIDKESSRCFILNWDKWQLEEFFPKGEHCTERPGGTFYKEDGKLKRVIQDCHRTYGEYIRIYDVERIDKEFFIEKEEKSVRVKDYKLDIPRRYQFTHQYSVSEHYEAIDFYYPRFYWNKLYRMIYVALFRKGRNFQ